MIHSKYCLHLIIATSLLVTLSGCGTKERHNPKDPWEGYNRAIFSFNEGVDRALIKPVAKGYDTIIPGPINTIITNFFNNIGDVPIAINNLLQGKVMESASDLGRVILNSTLGICGLIDVATGMTLEKHDEDFGQTFAHWGIGNGPYFMLPLIGPSTIRDSFGLVADWNTDPLLYVHPYRVRDSLSGLRQIDKRADLLTAEKVIDAGAIDKYRYLREAYFQRRNYLIYDGMPPREEEYE